MDTKLKDALIAKIIDVTKAWEKSNRGPKPETPEDEKAMKFARLIASKFSGLENSMALLIGELIGEPLLVDYLPFVDREKKGIVPSKQFLAIIPLMPFSSHNYPIGEVAVCLGHGSTGSFMRKDGTVGNNLTWRKDLIRAATEEEIKAMPDFQLQRIADSIANIKGLLGLSNSSNVAVDPRPGYVTR